MLFRSTPTGAVAVREHHNRQHAAKGDAAPQHPAQNDDEKVVETQQRCPADKNAHRHPQRLAHEGHRIATDHAHLQTRFAAPGPAGPAQPVDQATEAGTDALRKPVLVLRPGEGAQALTMLLGASLFLDGVMNLLVALLTVKIIRHQQPDVIETDEFEIK